MPFVRAVICNVSHAQAHVRVFNIILAYEYANLLYVQASKRQTAVFGQRLLEAN